MIKTFILILKIIGQVFKLIVDKNEKRRKQREEALKKIIGGIRKNNPSDINRGFDSINRM